MQSCTAEIFTTPSTVYCVQYLLLVLSRLDRDFEAGNILGSSINHHSCEVLKGFTLALLVSH